MTNLMNCTAQMSGNDWQNHRLVTDYEENTEVAEAFIQLAMILIMLKQLS